MALDTVEWTYPGWRQDKADAEDKHFNYPLDFDNKIESMRSKQKVHDGGRNHSNPCSLDAVVWTYPGWEKDKADAEHTHYNWPILVPDKLESMQKKQRVHDGDRSHPNLVALDAIEWTYPGWHEDKANAEDKHCNYPNHLFGIKIESMQRKQQHYDGCNACPIYIDDDDVSQVVNARPAKKPRTRAPSRLPTEDTSSKCVVCLQANKTHTFLPCGHICACEKCSIWAMGESAVPIAVRR